MRFTKIPLIATLMAVALSLLIVLPGLAQTSDITDGRQSVRSITVGVFDNVADAQVQKLVRSSYSFTTAPDEDEWPYVPSGNATPPSFGTAGKHTAASDPAYLWERETDEQDTLFNNTLYVSNSTDAYNTVLINVRNATNLTSTCVQTTVNNNTVNTDAARVTATVTNTRSRDSITLELPITAAGSDDSLGRDGTSDAAAGEDAQAFFKIVAEGDTGVYDPTPDDTTNDDAQVVAYTQHNGPTWCDNDKTRKVDEDNDTTTPDTDVQVETAAETAVYSPVVHSTIAAPGAEQEIGTIFARHGDRLTITTNVDSGQIELVVDGEGPEFSTVSPEDNVSLRPSRLNYSFEVRDDDSGLRHDGESVISSDGDYKEVNADGDHHRSDEPLSVDPNQQVDANGESADINVNIAVNPKGQTLTWDDISASGTWRMAGSRAGVAYSFSASGSGTAEEDYLYQLVATDRAGNTSKTDADPDTDKADAFVFNVDDTDPVLNMARTGITYDTVKDVEKVDRSFIALDFDDDALDSVNTDNITIVGHTIKSVVHPSKAPRINRGEATIATEPVKVAKPARVVSKPGGTDITSGFADTSGNNPFVLSPAATLVTGTLTDGTTAFNPTDLARSGLTTNVECNYTTNPAGTTDTDTTDANTPDAIDLAVCRWVQYNAYVAENTAYNEYLDELAQWEAENPGTDIEGKRFVEPRARIYLELSEDLASDETPSVLVIGGAVYDLAGNTNESKSLKNAADWIAPKLTVTVTGSGANDRPVANTKGSFTVDVRSDEDLRRRPVVYFVEITETQSADGGTDTTADDEYTYAITTGATNVDDMASLTQQEAENHWAKTYKQSTIESTFDGLFGVVLVGQDGDGNIGATTGWSKYEHRSDATGEDMKPNPGDALDLAKMDAAGLLAEIDKQFNGGKTESDSEIGTVTPRSNDAGTETESANPFVKLVFANEKNEYPAKTFKDSHDKVEVTKITLNGENASANLNRVSSTDYSLITRDLAVGKYTVEYTAVDDAGNELEDEFSFTVNERQPYELDVRPGWNLVSLPATPLEPAIGDVLAGNGYITPVLGYQQGDWLTAVREEDGTWRGRLTEIVGGYGYWVHARTFESIETMLAETDPAATLPTVSVTAGWNLLGVLDIFQNDAGKAPGASGDSGDNADNYFSSIPWRVAYSYDTTKSLWIKTTPKATATDADGNEVQEILNGNGYWVWSPSPSTLAP